jgi:hypothetical protein
MFSNPLFEWWMESLEERRLRSAGDDGAMTPPPAEPAQQGFSTEAQGPGQEDGGVTDGIRTELRRLADQLPGGADEAFVNEWWLGDDASRA